MAIEKMKRAYIVAHRRNQKKILEKLQLKKIIDLNNLHEKVTHFHEEIKLSEAELSADSQYTQLAQVRSIIRFIDSYSTEKKGFIKGMLPDKVETNLKEFFSKKDKVKIEDLYHQSEEIDITIKNCIREIDHLRLDEKVLSGWKNLKIPIGDIHPTKKTIIKVGEVENRIFEEFKEELSNVSELYELDEVMVDGTLVKLILIYHQEDTEEIARLLAKYEWNDFQLINYSGTPDRELENISNEISALDKKKEDLLVQADEYGKYRSDLLIIHDYLNSEIKKIEATQLFAQTRDVFMLEGWVRECDLDELKKTIQEITNEVEITAVEPGLEDEPPISLKNPGWLKPFEFITELFGPPNYREIDPTPILAPFFILFFGMCIGDVGYGVALMFFSWYLSKKIQLGENGQKFMKLMYYGGFTSIIFGVITGSYFAIEIQYLPSFLAAFSRFDFLNDSNSLIFYLIVSLGFGVIQLWTGIFVEFVDNLRSGNLWDGIFDQIPVMIMMPGLVLSVAYFLIMQQIEGTPGWATVGIYLFIIGTALVILFHGRASKNIFARLGGGLYSFYGLLTGLISDVVSYARLMALGVATFLIGYAINLLGGMFTSIPVIGLIITAIVYIVGHIVNLVINLISAFVHPVRLQFVEFFGKFYENGGKKYTPFQLESEKVIMKG